jgi:hypothetical protein
MVKGLVTVLVHSNQPIWFWAGSGPAHWSGPSPAHFKKNLKEQIFFNICDFPRVLFYAILFNLGLFSVILKKYESGIKIPCFHQNFQKYKKNKKNVFVHTAKCLKAKKSYCVCHTPAKKCFSMHFGFNNQFIKVKRILTKFSKTTTILFCLSFSIRGTTLHVRRILDLYSIFFGRRTVRFYPIKIRTSLLRRAFLEP